MWAAAHLVHAVRHPAPATMLGWLVLVAAVMALTRRSVGWLLGLAMVQVAQTFTQLPAPYNHVIIMAFVNVALLVGAGSSIVQCGELAVGLQRSLGAVRMVGLVSYGAAAVAKLNSGFFSGSSCAVSLLQSSLAVLGEVRHQVPVAVESAMPWIVAGVELLIVVLLVIPWARVAGVALAATFHLLMVASPTAQAGLGFTAMLLALLWLFLPEVATDRLKSRLGRVGTVVSGTRPDVQRLLIVFFLAALVLVYDGYLPRVLPFMTATWPVQIGAVLVLYLLIMDACWYSWTQQRRVQVDLRVHSLANLVVIGLLVVLAAAPYLGSRSVAVFTMYSNLQTADQRSNHFLLPRLPIQMSQDDLVTVAASSDPRLARLARGREQVTWHELRRLAVEAPEASISYVRGGQRHDLDRIADDPVLVSTHPLWHRLIAHRSYVAGQAPCAW